MIGRIAFFIFLLFFNFANCQIVITGVDSIVIYTNPDNSIDSIIVDNPIAEQDLLPSAFPINFKLCYNGSTELDQVILNDWLEPECIRSFILHEKLLPFDGVLSKGGVLLKDHTYSAIPDIFVGGVDFNGTFYPNHFRFETLDANTTTLIGASEAIVNFNGRFRDFPGKTFLLFEYGTTEQEQSEEIEYHYYSWLKSDGRFFQYLEFENEPWIWCIHELKLVIDAKFRAYIRYNNELGRFNPEDMRPKLGTLALPLGQGSRYKMTLEDVAEAYAPYWKYITYISSHPYPLDNNNEWSTDFNIVQQQVLKAESFRFNNCKSCELWITETGSKLDEVNYYTKLFRLANTIESIKMIIPYSYQQIDNFLFGELYMIDKQGNESDTYRYLRKFEDISNRL